MNRLKQLRKQGFDRSYHYVRSYKVRCSQCEAVCINGIPTHETGCPNAKKAERDNDHPDFD